MTTEAARAIATAFEAEGLVGCVGHIERYNPALQQAKARIRDGQIGEIIQIRHSSYRSLPRPHPGRRCGQGSCDTRS